MTPPKPYPTLPRSAMTNRAVTTENATMKRRTFLAMVSAAALARVVRAADLPKDLRITRAVGFELTSRRSKVAGKNARLDVHGDRATDRMIRLYTNQGIEGHGNCRAEKAQVAELI